MQIKEALGLKDRSITNLCVPEGSIAVLDSNVIAKHFSRIAKDFKN
jgi:hypothetical protein